MKLFFCFILLMEASLLNAQIKKQYGLSGDIIGKDSGIIYLQYYDEGQKIVDSAEIVNGHFHLNGYITEPVIAKLADIRDKIPNNYPTVFKDFYVDPVEMHISLINNHFKEANFTGGKTNEEWTYIESKLNPIYGLINNLKQSNTDDPATNLKVKDSIQYYNNKAVKIIIDFYNHYPNSIITAKTIPWLNQFGVSNDSLLYLLDNLSDNIKNTYSFQRSREAVLHIINSEINHTAQDFTRIDLNKKILSLSNFKGNYVLLDFWASWCEPCRAQTPHIKELYQKYHSKGLEIIAVSCDSKYQDWYKAITKDNISLFHNVLSFTDDDMNFLKTHDMYEASFKGELRKQYNLMPIPAQILIDKNGTIIGRIRCI